MGPVRRASGALLAVEHAQPSPASRAAALMGSASAQMSSRGVRCLLRAFYAVAARLCAWLLRLEALFLTSVEGAVHPGCPCLFSSAPLPPLSDAQGLHFQLIPGHLTLRLLSTRASLVNWPYRRRWLSVPRQPCLRLSTETAKTDEQMTNPCVASSCRAQHALFVQLGWASAAQVMTARPANVSKALRVPEDSHETLG